MSSIRQLRKRQQRKVTGFQHRAAAMSKLLSSYTRMPRMKCSILELDYMNVVEEKHLQEQTDILATKLTSVFKRHYETKMH